MKYHISKAIEDSRCMLDLEDDWDGYGASTISRDVWERATGFLRIIQDDLVDVPRISPLADGSIDLHWKTNTYELLIYVPADTNELAQYYGDDGKEGSSIKGELDITKSDQKLIAWIIERK